ncbi:MAG: recombinase family protein [Actinomycetota bacterium]|nr:recombinase family protein [Actinomycetota bacterium]
MTRAAVYTRVSSEEQASGGTSLETQAERCRAYCTARGWTVVDTYVDAGVSGAKASRPALDRLMADVRAGQVDAVVIAKLDRLGRSLRHLAPTLGEMDDRGVALVSVAETFDSGSASGRLLRGICPPSRSTSAT